MTFAERLRALHACEDAVAWVGDRTLDQAWAECERGDWMLWLAGRADIDRKVLVRAAVACARPALACVPEGEERPRIALDTAEAWCDSKATDEEVRAAVAAAHAAAYAAHAAADAAAYAAYASAAVAAAAAFASAAVAAVASAAAHAPADAASLRASADTVRALIPLDLIRAGLEASS